MNQTLKNKRTLINGGSRGIGAAIVKRLASDGADVALTYTSSPDQANKIVQAAQALNVRAIAIQADSADASAVVAAVNRTVAELGGIDILVYAMNKSALQGLVQGLARASWSARDYDQQRAAWANRNGYESLSWLRFNSP